MTSETPDANGATVSAAPSQDEPELLDKIRQCLEELLSKDSLAEDMYIRKHMNAQLYIPLCLLAAHRTLVALGPGVTVNSVLAAAKVSDRLNVDEANLLVRPATNHNRNTIILHDLPEGVTEEDLKELLKTSPEFDKLCSVKPDVNHTAYITMQTDDAAQSVALWLRSKKLKDEPIKTAIKSEHVVRGFYPIAPPHPVGTHVPAWVQQIAQRPMSAGSVPSSPFVGPAASDGGKGGKHGNAEFDMIFDAMSQAQQVAQHQEHPDDDGTQVGYGRDFRRYTRQELVDIIDTMSAAKIPKPETFAKMERENRDIGLFRKTACKEWAPVPTPMNGPAAALQGARAAGHHGAPASGGDARKDDHGEAAAGGGATEGKEGGHAARRPAREGKGGHQAWGGGGDERGWDWSTSWGPTSAAGGKPTAAWRPKAQPAPQQQLQQHGGERATKKPTWVEKVSAHGGSDAAAGE
eukprot:CAMPEP_0176192348 /NCGR_PEP_ID=MMETSP0121_2-20121125/4927_1 /TAXON_ID=160619 /ORGANISM="Kryptoperidinium foliaceum, Strain CCMP 1326" /LENGTH=463 /DNA_ID=CAMNT_0017531037 /DNA_START=69 /DNA_END=1457 /DNA_ORIENTATION=-